jgi:hypothetical protein
LKPGSKAKPTKEIKNSRFLVAAPSFAQVSGLALRARPAPRNASASGVHGKRCHIILSEAKNLSRNFGEILRRAARMGALHARNSEGTRAPQNDSV